MDWNLDSGEYEPSVCPDCCFPLLAHHPHFCWGLNKKRNPGTPPKSGWSPDSITRMNSVIMKDVIIRATIDEKDVRPHKTACTCGKQFPNRLELKQHESLKHNRHFESVVTAPAHSSSPNYQPKVVVQVTEPPKVPKWDKEEYEVFEKKSW